MSIEIVVRPAAESADEIAGGTAAYLGGSALGARFAADLEEFCRQISARFPSAEAVGETGALAERPTITHGSVVLLPELATIPLVINAAMRIAAPLQLTVEVPEQKIVADPRNRVEVDVHRVASTAHATIHEHHILGRPHGTLPWVTRRLLGQLIDGLERVGDRVELRADEFRWFRIERPEDTVHLTVADGPDAPERSVELAPGGAGDAVAAEVAWRWARCDAAWVHSLEWESTALV